MKLLTELFSDNLVTALGWSLFHILWQGFIVALILGISLRLLRNKSAQTRYIISTASLLLMVGLSVFNFYKHYDSNLNTAVFTENFTQLVDDNNALVIDFSNADMDLAYTNIVSNINQRIEQIDRFFPIIVNAWLMGVFMFVLKFIFSYLYTNRLKKVKTQNLSEDWLRKFYELEEKLKIRKTIQYIESRLVKVPLVLGYLKPVIVIPAEMFLGIPANQIDAIIAHELAHIRRNDYIINVIQTIIETVFFFHPAVWFISSKIRNERENCCDDMALTVCEGSLVYAKALVSVQELTLGRHYTAVAFSDNKKHLLNRIKRMIMKPKMKSNFTDKIIAATVILSAVFALSFTTEADITNYISEKDIPAPPKIISPVISPAPTPIVTVKDTVKIRKHRHDEIDIDDNTITRNYRDDKGNKKEMKLTLKNGKVVELYVDGEKIQESDFNKYQPEIDETLADLKEAKEDIKKAMKEVEDIDIEKIKLEIEESMKDIHIDMAEVQQDIAKAMENVREIDVNEIMKEVEMQMEQLNDLDFDFDFDFDMDELHVDTDKIRKEMEEVRKSIHENVDVEEIQKKMQKVQEEISKINMEEIKMQVEQNLKHFEEFDKEETIKNLEEKLQELEILELEEK